MGHLLTNPICHSFLLFRLLEGKGAKNCCGLHLTSAEDFIVESDFMSFN